MHNSGQMTDEPGSGWADFGFPGTTLISVRTASTSRFVHRAPVYALLIQGLELTDDPIFANQWDKDQWQAGKEKFREIRAKTRQEWCDQFEELTFVLHQC